MVVYVIRLLENKLPKKTGIIMFMDAILHVMKVNKLKEISLEEFKELRQRIIDYGHART